MYTYTHEKAGNLDGRAGDLDGRHEGSTEVVEIVTKTAHFAITEISAGGLRIVCRPRDGRHPNLILWYESDNVVCLRQAGKRAHSG